MAASSFDAALARVLVHEGGWSDHPKDPGGTTMKGVTQRTYDAWRRRQGLATRSVRRIASAEVEAIYRAQYWDAVRADALPAGLDYCVFDAAVNSGPAQAAKWLQRGLGVAVDGIIGEATLAAVSDRPVVALIEGTCERRLAMLRALSTWSSFGKGWSRRVAEVRVAAKAMAGRDEPAPPTAPLPAEIAKARACDTRIARTPEGAGGLVAGAGGIGAVLAEQAERLAPFAEFSAVLKWLFAGLLMAGVALTLAAVWRRLRVEGGVAPEVLEA
ncbi:glycoside hydrolase family 108 protein [Bosea sp. 117]|uniref:glycoside hydrolase family 108 protein n=1 Tax=Bosea sp. 117 TaxID=1125973 RepID=UPI0004945892|nr:glycoside hydrolase family 108 protein [Bosea sp. 117]